MPTGHGVFTWHRDLCVLDDLGGLSSQPRPRSSVRRDQAPTPLPTPPPGQSSQPKCPVIQARAACSAVILLSLYQALSVTSDPRALSYHWQLQEPWLIGLLYTYTSLRRPTWTGSYRPWSYVCIYRGLAMVVVGSSTDPWRNCPQSLQNLPPIL